MIDRDAPEWSEAFGPDEATKARVEREWTTLFQKFTSAGWDRWAAENKADFEVYGYCRYRYMTRNG